MQYTSIQLHTSPTKLSDYFSKQTFIFNWDINNNPYLKFPNNNLHLANDLQVL